MTPSSADISTPASSAGSGPTPSPVTLKRYGTSIGPGMKSNHGKNTSPVSRMVTNVYAGYMASAP